MDFKKLSLFCKVFELRSFSKAAQQAYLTQPSVSGYIASLENLLGTRLFDRQGREVVPTQAGEIFYKYAKRLLALKEEAENEVNLFLGYKKGNLKLGGSTIPGQYILPKLLGKFKSIYPDVKIFLKISDTKQIVDFVLNGEIEIGTVGAKLSEPKLAFVPFAKDELVLAMPSDYALSPKEFSLTSLQNLPFILREQGSGTRMVMEHFLNQRGINIDKLNIVAELGSTEAVRQAIINGIGISILSKRAIEIELKAGLIKIVYFDKKPLSRDFYLVYLKHKTLSPFAQAFLEFALEKTESE